MFYFLSWWKPFNIIKIERNIRPNEGKFKFNIQNKVFLPAFSLLTFWRRNYFINFSTPVYKMWIIQESNKLELWNRLHFEEKKTESICHV